MDVSEKEERVTEWELEAHTHTHNRGFRQCGSFILLECFPKFVPFLLILHAFLLLTEYIDLSIFIWLMKFSAL